MAESEHNAQDRAAGILFLVIGVVSALVAASYNMGTLRRIGPGVYPLSVATLLAIFGVVILIRAGRFRLPRRLSLASGAAKAWDAVHPVLTAALPILLFAFLLKPLGLIISTFALVFVSRIAAGSFRPIELVVLSSTLAGSCLVVFVYLLKLPIQVWPV